MLPPFDIFKIEASGEVLWIRSAADLNAARLAVKELMAASPHEYIIHSHNTNNDLVIRPPTAKRRAKPLIFQIAYDERLMATRAELLKSHGFTVISVIGNEAAKAALATPRHYSLFILGTSAPTKVRREMADWLKANYPKVPLLALNPPFQQQLEPADYNVVLNGPGGMALRRGSIHGVSGKAKQEDWRLALAPEFAVEVVRVEPKLEMAYVVGVKPLHAKDPVAPHAPDCT